LPSGVGGAVTVQLLEGTVPVGTATTGANGYYYLAAPAGTFSPGVSLQANIISGGPSESGSYTPTMDFVAQPGVNIYGNGPTYILPTQGSANLATPTSLGSLTDAILSGGIVAQGTVGYISIGSVATVTLTAPRTLIDWTTFEVGPGATLNFQFTNSASDIVLNRLVGGTIAIDAGGAVNGYYGNQLAGNIWFLGGAGVLINGGVAAGGVLATNNTAVADFNLLSDPTATLKGELVAGGGLIDLTSNVSVSGAAIDGAGAIMLSGDITTDSTGAVNLVATGPISQTGGSISTGSLSGSSVGGADLTGANIFDTLAGFTNTGAGAVSITDAQTTGLTVSADVDAGIGNNLILTTTGGGALTLAANLTASGGSVNLVSSGAISQASGVITTSVLAGSSAGGADLTGANVFDTLAGFTNTGLGNVSIVDALATGLTVSGDVDAGMGNTLILTTIGGGSLTLAANLTAGGGSVDLLSGGPISQTSGAITTSVLTGSSAGGASLTDANLFDTLAGFTNTGVGNVSITDAQATGLTVSADVDAGTKGALTLTATGGGLLTLAANLTAGGGAVDLVSSGAISQASGVITATVLTGSSSGGASLTDANLFDTLAGFTNTGIGNVSITDAQASGLTVFSAVDAGAGNTLTLTTTGGSLTLAANLAAAGGAVDLISAGAITQPQGAISTGALSGSSVGGTSLTGANAFDTLAGFTNTGLGNVSITDAQASGLTVSGDVDAGTGNTLILTTTGGSLTLAANLTASGGSMDLASIGPINQTGGVITTSVLTGSSSGGASLTDANLFDSLAGFTNTGVGDVSITDAQTNGLTVISAVDAGAGNTLTLTTTGGSLTLAANLTAAGGAVDLVSAGAITQPRGAISTGALSGSSVGGADLTGANLFDTLAGFTNTGLGNVSITDAQAGGLTVSGDVDAGTKNTLLLTTTGGGPLTLAASLTALGGAVNLVSSGAIIQTAGSVSTGFLTGSSVGGTALGDANQISVLGAFGNSGAGGFTLVDAAPLSVAGGITLNAGAGTLILVDTGGGIATGQGSALTAGQDINLDATGGAVAVGGPVTAGRNIFVAAATFSDPQGVLTAPGALALYLSDPNGVSLTATPTIGPGSDIVASNLLSPNVTIDEVSANLAGVGISGVTLPGVVSTFSVFTNGLVDVTGPLLPGGANVALVIGDGTVSGTPTEIRVQNIVGSGSAGGAIGSPAAPFSVVSLIASGDILLGEPAFDRDAEQIPRTIPASAVNPLTPAPAPPFTPDLANRADNAVFLATTNLVIAAGGRVLQQNTSGSQGMANSGTLIGGDLTLNPYNGLGPLNFDLFAMFINPTLSGPALAMSPRIALNTPLSDPNRSFYRIDGCVIQLSGGCMTMGLTTEQAAAESAAIDGPLSGKAATVVTPLQMLPVYLLSQPQTADLADTSVIGATNEEIWRKLDQKKR
jgi:hypothetical protein